MLQPTDLELDRVALVVLAHEAAIRETFGVSVLAVGDGADSWHVNPGDGERLVPGSVMIVIGSNEQVEALQLAAGAT